MQKKIYRELSTKDGYEKVNNLYANLSLPSYAHGYSLAIEYMYNWFKNKFDKNFFRGGIYVDGKHVLDDYKSLNSYLSKNTIKRENPRARMEPRVEFDYDREGIDFYQGPTEVFIRRSKLQNSFFKDYDRDLYLGFVPRVLRMNVGYKVRVNTRAQQLDLFNKMELHFRNGATQYEYISVDFHVPKYIILNIAEKAGFEVKNGEVVDILDFINYLNRHSDVPFLFKLRAINQHIEYFIRINDLYTHIAVRDKLQLDDGERDGKLDSAFHIEMQAVLEMPVPHYYVYYSADELTLPVTISEAGVNEYNSTTTNESGGCSAIYSINILELPKVDEHGWNQAVTTEYQLDEGEEYIDLSAIFSGSNSLTRAIDNNTKIGVSPSSFINIVVYRDDDISKLIPFKIDWYKKHIVFKKPESEGIAHIVIYYDREYVNNLDKDLDNLRKNRISINKDNNKL
jgi:hypothetical protein